MAAPPSHIVEKGKREAIEVVRRTIAPAGAHLDKGHNLIGVSLGQGDRPKELQVVSLPGEGGLERHVRCNAFCAYLANRVELVQAFNSLLHLHQIVALLLHEPEEEDPHSVKEWFLRATGPQRQAAWQAAMGQDGALEKVLKESKLWHMETFFRERSLYRASERVKPACPGGMCPEEREKQWLEGNLYILTRRLKRQLLSITNTGDFQLWKLDLLEAWAAMYLPMAQYQSTVNHLIVGQLEADLQATMIDIIPEEKAEFGTRKPEEFLQQIGDRLGRLSQEEQERACFLLARQKIDEDPEGYKDRLCRYYEETLLRYEPKFVKKYMSSVYNKLLGKLLQTHEPPLVTIRDLEREIPYYVAQMRAYAEVTPDAVPEVIAGLAGMRYGIKDGSLKVGKQI